MPKIFDPYFSTKYRGSQKGMGFGLAIAHSVIKKHNGHITVESDSRGREHRLRSYSRIVQERPGCYRQLRAMFISPGNEYWSWRTKRCSAI